MAGEKLVLIQWLQRKHLLASRPQLHEENPLVNEKWQLRSGKETAISDGLHGIAVWTSPHVAIHRPRLVTAGGEIHCNTRFAAVFARGHPLCDAADNAEISEKTAIDVYQLF